MPESKSRLLRIAVMLSGRGSNFRALDSAIESGTIQAEIVLVLSDQPDAPGLEHAKSRGLQTAVVRRRPKEISNAEFNTELASAAAAAAPDLIVLAGFMRVLTPEFISRFPARIINIHPSLLPAFKGLSGQRQALEAGVKVAGCSVHVVEEELDSGPILAQAAVPVLPDDTEDTLSARILKQEHLLLPAVVRAIAAGELVLRAEGAKAVVEWRGEPRGEKETASLRSLF